MTKVVLSVEKTGSVMKLRRSSVVRLRRLLMRLVRRVFGQVSRGIILGKVHFAYAFIVAIAYVMQKTPYVFPIIGCRSPESFKENVEALSLSLTPEQVKYIESEGPPFDPGFPHNIMVSMRSHYTLSSQ